MVYFEFNQLGYNCGVSKAKCQKYPKYCMSCLKKKLKELNFEVDSSFEVYELDSYERHLQVEREIIWQKFLDVLNIRHILVIDKESGLKLLSYSILGVNLDADLLSGFIQANITFSESEEVSLNGKKYMNNRQFYEFQYKNFNILLKDGGFIRLCLILDHKASDNMRTDVLKFLYEFEEFFNEEITKFKKSGSFSAENMTEYLVDALDITLVFPMSLAHSIPPNELEKINENQIQKAILNLAKEFLASKPFFFINNLLNRVKNIVNLDSSIILYEIYQLIENRIIISTNLETVASDIELKQEAKSEKMTKYKSISSIITDNSQIEELQIEEMNEDSARDLIKGAIKKGKNAEKTLAYQIAAKEYKKALYVAREFNLKENISKISQMLLDLENKEKQLELEFVLKAGENAEKTGDYLNSINNYQKALKILEGFLIFNVSDSRIKKLKKKIIKLRSEI
ncbi:MAG: hypothetical protein ACXAC5_05935 [Promethearchaeota archaeon]|jgi:hypothetical protein